TSNDRPWVTKMLSDLGGFPIRPWNNKNQFGILPSGRRPRPAYLPKPSRWDRMGRVALENPSVDPGEAAWDLLPAAQALSCPAVRRHWAEFLAASPGARRERTPEWLAHVGSRCAAGDRAVLAVARARGVVRGLAPLHVGRDRIPFRAAGR